MVFNPSLYEGNVEICKYVWDKNQELKLDLENDEIQIIADMYELELAKLGDKSFPSKFVANDLLLIQVIKDYVKEFRKHPELEGDSFEHAYDGKYAAEKAHGAHGGYGYNESFDDFGLDEIVPEEDEGKSL